ncbi:hypothetical protein KI387_022571 [Taxus chinensis]|uniref:Uncharacterized protein n=1 Tax=Taxus chinensis TaxID=29808 RepID=A0AA38G0J8_TAXCH|nr:hypothetical protein KI387_022571 [Taxus chinensis]
MSRRRALDMTDAKNMVIAKWAYEMMLKGRAAKVIDNRLRDEVEIEAVAKPSIQQALSALESIDCPGHRPPLPDVISFSSNASGSGSASASSGNKLAVWDWVVSVEESYGSNAVAVSAMSTESY